jgi:hypothetical protein
MFDRQKFKALVHYICYRRSVVDPSSLGAVKLNKILWYSDLAAYYELGQSITGARYVKRRYGPVPHQIKPVLRELEDEGALEVKDSPYYGKTKKTFIVKKVAQNNFASPEELDIVQKMIDLICDEHTATSISRASHDHIWKAAEDGEEIPYFTVFATPGHLTEEDREWARYQLETIT